MSFVLDFQGLLGMSPVALIVTGFVRLILTASNEILDCGSTLLKEYMHGSSHENVIWEGVVL